MNEADIEKGVKEILLKRLDIDPEKILRTSCFKDDLGMDSFGAVEVMFEIEDNFVSNWQKIDIKQKKIILEDEYKLASEMIEDILLRDSIFPLWGVVEGRLKSEYENVAAKLTDNELIIYLDKSGKSYYFDRGDAVL